MINKKIYACLFIVAFLNISIFVSAVSDNILIDDPENDQMYFEYKWLHDETNIDDPTAVDVDGLDESFDMLEVNWNTEDEDIGNAVEEPDYGDIDKAEILLDKDKIRVTFFGDVEGADNIWAFFIWSNCSSDTWSTMIFYMPVSLGGDDEAYYFNYYGDNDSDVADMDGSTVEIPFNSDEYDEKTDCSIRCMMCVVDYDEDAGEILGVTFDIAPVEVDLADWFFQWLWLFLIIIAVAIVGVLIYLYKKKSKEKRGK